MQAIGRGRGVNRTAADPLDIDIIANVVLPLTVDAAEPWSPPGEEIEMQIEGIVLDSPADMAATWPEIWPSDGAARNWVYRHSGAAADKGHTVTEPYKDHSYIGFCDGVRFRYQRPGPRQKWRTGAYDPAVVPDPRAWLESRLGPIAGFHILETAQPDAAPASPPPLHAEGIATDIRERLRRRQSAGPRPAAEYDPALVARFHLVAEGPPEPFRPAPVRGDVLRFDSTASIRFPVVPRGRLAVKRAAEVANRVRTLEGLAR